tara:strand:+ start:2857 stop:3075 length:219 start_codon:yes stop_codon:yes gene_type:complete
VKDASVAVRGIKRYWRFLENNNISWDNFPKQQSIKPTYLYSITIFSEVSLTRFLMLANYGYYCVNEIIIHES